MKIDQLKYFLETAKHEHLGKASRALNVSASTVSHAISNLEEELGRELFLRQGKRIFLSSHGRLLAERAAHLIVEAENIFEEIKSDRVELTGHYRIGATHLICENFVAPAWAIIQKNNPGITADLFTFRSAQVVQKVSENELDLGICLSPQSSSKIEQEILFEDELVIAVRRRHPVSKLAASEQMQALSRFGAVLPKAFQGIESCETHPEIRRHGITSEVKLMYDSYGVAIQAVLHSDMWTLLPKLIFEKNHAGLECLRPRQWNAPYNVSAVWQRQRRLSHLLDEAKALVRQRMNSVEA